MSSPSPRLPKAGPRGQVGSGPQVDLSLSTTGRGWGLPGVPGTGVPAPRCLSPTPRRRPVCREVAGQWDLGVVQRSCVSWVIFYCSLVRRKHQNSLEDVRPSCPGSPAPGHSPLVENVGPQEAPVARCLALAPSLPE